MSDGTKNDYSYEDYLESGEVKPDPTIVKSEVKLKGNEYTSGFLNEQHENLPGSSIGEDLNEQS